jgi:hypothetical protein
MIVVRAVAVVSEPAITNTFAWASNHSSDFWPALSDNMLTKKSCLVISSRRATRERTCLREYSKKRLNFCLIPFGRERRMNGHARGKRRPISNNVTRIPPS